MTVPAALTPPALPRPAAPPRPRALPALGLVALAYGLAQLAGVVPWLGLGWDETVYVSQVDPHRPAAYFSAPRSRGISYLAAPVLWLTHWPPAVHLWLGLLAAAALYGAFAVWRPLLGAGRCALAAGLFAAVWSTLLYGPQAMPNLWVALCAVAASGCLLRAAAATGPARRALLLGVAGTVTGATLLRFPDGCWLALPLLLASVLHRPLRAPGPFAAVAGGLAAGAAPWVGEAYARWGGIAGRLRVSSAVQGDMGLRWAGGDAWRSLNGPLLCRPCTVEPAQPWLTWWWLALPPLAAAVCVRARRGRRITTWLPVGCAAALSAPYLLALGYSAPRFLLPAYALLALPLAAGLLDAVAGHGPRYAAGAVAAVLCLHLATQAGPFRHNLHVARETTARYAKVAAYLNAHGIRPPCLVTGAQAPPIGYSAGCASGNLAGNNRNLTRARLTAKAARLPTAAVAATRHGPPPYARDWRPVRVPGTGLTVWVAPGGGG
ncbi:hypothetical protein [Streptomyces sp. NPDC007088]|uniref:hypothetical protein n=1 Tax=Streptomyces sp. NPDC007088 TaxID=3364773 RepID=UPI003696DA01